MPDDYLISNYYLPLSASNAEFLIRALTSSCIPCTHKVDSSPRLHHLVKWNAYSPASHSVLDSFLSSILLICKRIFEILCFSPSPLLPPNSNPRRFPSGLWQVSSDFSVLPRLITHMHFSHRATRGTFTRCNPDHTVPPPRSRSALHSLENSHAFYEWRQDNHSTHFLLKKKKNAGIKSTEQSLICNDSKIQMITLCGHLT